MNAMPVAATFSAIAAGAVSGRCETRIMTRVASNSAGRISRSGIELNTTRCNPAAASPAGGG